MSKYSDFLREGIRFNFPLSSIAIREVLVKRYENYYRGKQYKKALGLLEIMRKCFGDCYEFYVDKADTLIAMGNNQLVAKENETEYDEQRGYMLNCHKKAKLALDSAEKFANTHAEKCRLLYWKSKLEPINDANGGRRKYLIGAMDTDNENDKELFMEEYDKCTSLMKEKFKLEKFTNIDYLNRKYVFIVSNEDSISKCYDEKGNINWVFTRECFPSDIEFPLGHPQTNTLYIAHPVKKEIYIPYQGSSVKFLEDKFNELCHILQCLGATDVSYRVLKGNDTSTAVNETCSISGGIGDKKTGCNVSGQVGSGSCQSSSNSHKGEMVHICKYNPTNTPYCPTDVHWMKTEKTWENLVKQRLDGNLLEFEDKISTKYLINISSSQEHDIKCAIDSFVGSGSANYESKDGNTFSESEETEWQINVKFKPLEAFTINNSEKTN